MLKKFTLLTLGMLSSISIIIAQITITNATFPTLGDTLSFAFDTQPNIIALTPPGGNQIWDFTSLNANFTQQQIFKNPSTGVGNTGFPEATLLYVNNNVENYLNIINQGSKQILQFLGYYGNDPIGLGIKLTARYSPPIVEKRAPMQFFDINSLSSALSLPFSTNVLPDTLLQQLPVRPDSLRIRIAINRLDVVDAWGNLSIPDGSYPVLREKRTTYRETRLDAKVSILGWIDITDVARQSLNLNTLGVDTTLAYHFFSNTAKEPIAIVTLDNAGAQVTGVQYKLNQLTTDVTQIDPEILHLSAFPNPASDKVQLRFNNIKSGQYHLKIYNVLGMEVWRKSYQIPGKQFETDLDIGRLEAGIYLYQLIDNQGTILTVKQLAVVKS